MAKVIKEYCPNIYFLHIEIHSEEYLDSIIPPICELSSLKILKIRISDSVDADILVKMLGDYLTFVECLFLDFSINLLSFEYFTNNCKANLKKLVVTLADFSVEDYLMCMNNCQMVHNSLKVFGK